MGLLFLFRELYTSYYEERMVDDMKIIDGVKLGIGFTIGASLVEAMAKVFMESKPGQKLLSKNASICVENNSDDKKVIGFHA